MTIEDVVNETTDKLKDMGARYALYVEDDEKIMERVNNPTPAFFREIDKFVQQAFSRMRAS